MNSCNTIRSVELLYYYSYYYWCTYILARYTRFSLLLYYLNLLSCLLWFSIFLVYISCFAFFLIQFNFPTTFFKWRLLKFIIFFRCEIVCHLSCSCIHLSSSNCNVVRLLCKKCHSSLYVSGNIQLCFVCSIIPLFNVSLNL